MICKVGDIKEELSDKRRSSRKKSSYVKYFTSHNCDDKVYREEKDDHEASCELLNISKRNKPRIYRSPKTKQQDKENGYMYECSVKIRIDQTYIDDLREEKSKRVIFDSKDKRNLTRDDEGLLLLEVTKSVSYKQTDEN
uniref:Uncharacterized protein n=1 Tax=Strongyloides papillosus TaxID=174720 RepID=A0A0N5BPA1_STREA